MNNDLADLAERTIDETIRSFNPGDRGSFDHWDGELQRVEEAILNDERLPERQALLASIRSQRIDLAVDVEDWGSVAERSAQFVHDFPPNVPNFFSVVTLRARALHKTGSHELEIEESLMFARLEEIKGSEYVLLLDNLSARHPGRIPSEEGLWSKMRSTVSMLREAGYSTLIEVIDDSMSLELVAQGVARELRRVNRAKGEELLASLK
jgi:hypothetical protein